MAQLCAIDIAHSKVLGDVPILGLGWAAPKIGNSALSRWVEKQDNLRILRIKVPADLVSNSELYHCCCCCWVSFGFSLFVIVGDSLMLDLHVASCS